MNMRPAKVGDLRPSQLIFTFGIGSLLDLPHMSVIVMGLDDWDRSRCLPITEDRLLNAVRAQMGLQVEALLKPPMDPDAQDENPFGPQIGVPVVPFPRWVRCPRCDVLAPLSSGLFSPKIEPYRPDRARFIHTNCNKSASPPPVLPVRFILACKNGHLDDFPWDWYVHRGGTCSKGAAILRLREFGISGEASDIVVQCDSCAQQRRLGDAVGGRAKGVLPPCRGRHPHLHGFSGDEQCEEVQRVTLLGASNSWFPLTLSTLSLPPGDDKLMLLVEKHWAKLQKARSAESLEDMRSIGVFPDLDEFGTDKLWEAVEKRRNGGAGEIADSEDLKRPEWVAFSNPTAQPKTDDFKLEPVDPPRGYEHVFEKTVLVQRIREVRALLGFTRIESPGDFCEPDEVPEGRKAPLSRNAPMWLPASEVRGEGIFLHFNADFLKRWRNDPSVLERERTLFEAHKAWRAMRKIEPVQAGFPRIVYVAVHSVAHALMRTLSLVCGYTAASIRERIYVCESENPAEQMAGLLIYTAAPDSEGTLGGLVGLGEPGVLGAYFDQALEQIRFCTSDPLCAEHSPVDSLTVHGAACHACLFAPETSCERGNKYLDRGVLVNTYAQDGTGLFEDTFKP
jgi:hypothetical protein